MKIFREKGFTLAELLVVILILAILATVAVVFFPGRVQLSRDNVSEANLRAALLTSQVEYLKEGESFISGQMATGSDNQEKANNFIIGAIEKNSNMVAVASSTPDLGEIGVQMNTAGTAGTLYAKKGEGYIQRALP